MVSNWRVNMNESRKPEDSYVRFSQLPMWVLPEVTIAEWRTEWVTRDVTFWKAEWPLFSSPNTTGDHSHLRKLVQLHHHHQKEACLKGLMAACHCRPLGQEGGQEAARRMPAGAARGLVGGWFSNLASAQNWPMSKCVLP